MARKVKNFLAFDCARTGQAHSFLMKFCSQPSDTAAGQKRLVYIRSIRTDSIPLDNMSSNTTLCAPAHIISALFLLRIN